MGLNKYFCLLFFVFTLFMPSVLYAQINTKKVEEATNMLVDLLGGIDADSENGVSINVEKSSLEAQGEANQLEQDTMSKETEILNPWKNKLPFEITLDKIRTFIIAGRAVDKSNRSWDVMIAAAESAEKAMGLHSQATEEAVLVIKEVPGISLPEYKALYDLSISDPDFATLIRALRDHIYPDENVASNYSN